jgi:hypothetical protein
MCMAIEVIKLENGIILIHGKQSDTGLLLATRSYTYIGAYVTYVLRSALSTEKVFPPALVYIA